MKFLLDENADARLLTYLADQGHDATQIATHYPAELSDERVLSLAHREGRILLTNDKDFGELVFRKRLPHQGVILFRLGYYAPLATRIARLEYVLAHDADRLDQFLTVTPHRVRARTS
jgi:predicted nuclease of predicted toxin-antitoxin system